MSLQSVFTPLNTLIALVSVIPDYQFFKASRIVVFSCELQVRTFSNYYFGSGEDVQATNDMTTNHVTLSIAE